MAIKAPGGSTPTNSLSFTEIEAEFGQNNDRDLGEYRVSQTIGALVNQPLDEGIPQGTSPIRFSDFYSKRLNVVIDYHSGSTENRPTVAKTRYDAAAGTGTHTVIGGFKTRPANSGGTKTRIHVNKSIGSSNTNVNNCAVRTGTGWNAGTILTIEIGSSGVIVGAGGDGGNGGTGSSPNGANGGTGSSGLGIQYSGTTIINNGSITAGGGGGGGGGYRKVEREENFSGPVVAANGGGGGGGQGLPGGSGGSGSSTGGAGGASSGGNGGKGGDDETKEDTFAFGGGGGGGAFNGTGGEGGTNSQTSASGNDGADGTSSKGGNGASGSHSGSIEGENNVQGSGGTGGSNGAAIRRSSSSIEINYAVSGTITGDISATGVS